MAVVSQSDSQIKAPRAPRRHQTEVDRARQEKNEWKARALKAERALALIRINCVALANDDKPDVAAASGLAYRIAKRLRLRDV